MQSLFQQLLFAARAHIWPSPAYSNPMVKNKRMKNKCATRVLTLVSLYHNFFVCLSWRHNSTIHLLRGPFLLQPPLAAYMFHQQSWPLCMQKQGRNEAKAERQNYNSKHHSNCIIYLLVQQGILIALPGRHFDWLTNSCPAYHNPISAWRWWPCSDDSFTIFCQILFLYLWWRRLNNK